MKIKNQMLLKYVFTLFCFIFSNLSWSDSEINTAPTPNWVSPVVLPTIDDLPTEKIQNGVYYLLLDNQVIVNQAQEPQYYRHKAFYIVNQTGVVDNSQINMNYDPSYQKLMLHSLHIIRDGLVIDKVNTARMKLIQREEESEKLIYNGRMTANIILTDVRVGDIVEYSYSIQGINPVYQNIFSYDQYLNWSVPVGRLSLRLLWNKPSSLKYQIDNSDLKLTQTQTTDGIEYLLQADHIEPVIIENNTPAWFNPWGYVSFSELHSWREVANWSQHLYQNAFVEDDEIKQLAESIRSENSNIDLQISAALRFVQDEVRYLGIELGQNSHLPTPALETLHNRYGDCKDKTVLLIALLKELGVEAYPALVNTEVQLDKSLPNVNAFDHVITLMHHKGKHYWLDPTRSYQYGGIDDIQQADYGYALIVRPNTVRLTQMLSQPSKYGMKVKDSFTLPANGNIIFTSESVYYGSNAERQRQRSATKGLDQLQREYLEFFQSYYPGIEVIDTIKFKDNSHENILTTSEKYRINNFWEEDTETERLSANFYGNIVSYLLAIPDEVIRSHPLYLSHPVNLEQTIEINFDDDNWYFDNEKFIADNEFFHFRNEINFNETQRQLSLLFVYQSKAEYIPPEKYPSYLTALRKVEDNLSYGIYKSSPDAAVSSPIENNPSFTSEQIIFALSGLYIILFLTVFILWRLDRRRNPDTQDEIFFPVSMLKLTAMWILTFGFYGMYWFYKNFRYIKEQEKGSSMPIARGLFCYLWYFPLWRKLKLDCDQRFEQSHLPGKLVAIILALAFFIAVILGNSDTLLAPLLIVSAILVFPLANYIHFVNGNDSKALKKNSKWSFRHYLLAALSLPLLSLTIGSEIGILPSDSVVKGSHLLEYNIKQMQRRGVLNPGDKIEYFYSDAFLLISDDGNGFTERHVFSYWKNEDNSFAVKQATYDEIQDIKVEWEDEFAGNTTVSIIRKDGSDFILYVSNTDHKDRVFVNALLKHWNTAIANSG